MTEKTFPAQTERLDEVIAFLESETEKTPCDGKTVMQLSVALEEMFVNVASYAYPSGEGEVVIGITAEKNSVTVCLTDFGVPFNPLYQPAPDVTLSAEERQIGGLGIFMVKKTMDEVFYEYRNGSNIFTMKKNF